MTAEKPKYDSGFVNSLRLTNLFDLGKKTKDTNEEIYHNANFTDIDKLKEPENEDESFLPDKKQ